MPPTTPATNPDSKTELTPEEIQAQEAQAQEADKPIQETAPAATFLKNLISAKPKEAKEDAKKKKEDTAAKPEAKDGEAAADAAEEPPRKKKKLPAPAPVIDEEKLGASIGKSIAEHTAKATTTKESDKAADEKELSDADKRRIAVMERMEKADSERSVPVGYKGLAERYKENKTKLKKYAAEWEKENPGEKFDESADEHADFIEALEAQVHYEDDDYTEALADIRADQKMQSQKSEIDARIAKVERTERVREETPKIRTAAATAGNEYWKDMGEDFKNVIGENGEVNAEALKSMAESDPVKHDIVVGAADAVERTAATIFMLANDLAAYDAKNPVHASLAQFAISQEEAMLKQKPEARRDEQGRSFVRKVEYDRMNKTEREQHWTFTPDDLTYMATRSISSQAKQNLKVEDEKFQRRAKARGLIKDGDDAAVAPARRPAPAHTAFGDDDESDEDSFVGKPKSPSVSSSPKLAAGKAVNQDEEKTGADRFMGRLLGR